MAGARLRWSPLVACITCVMACGSDATSPNSPPSSPVAAASLALGSQFTCALTADAKARCWGNNLNGQLGDSSFTQKLVPSGAIGGHEFLAIAAATTTACALDRAGAAWCWGDDPSQPGVPLSYRAAPAAIGVPVPLATLAVGRKLACGLDASGNAYCWGENGHGQLGVGDTLTHTIPVQVSGGFHFTSIATGFWHVCALTAAGTAYCWGDNTYGELGSGDTISVSRPRQVNGTNTFTSLAPGSVHQCAIASTGSAMCWGSNLSGQQGDGTITRHLLPTSTATGLTFTALRSGRANSTYETTCGITTGGDLYCWGWSSKGQLGNSNAGNTCGAYPDPFPAPPPTNPLLLCSFLPLKVTGLSNVVAVDVGFQHTCALTATAQLYCWGENASGELGDGSGIAQNTPVLVKGGLTFP